MTREALERAATIEDVAAVARGFRGRVTDLLGMGLDSEGITAAITDFNDAATRRLIALVGAEQPFRDAGACWIALGSEGRDEQTLASDQDNALVFADCDAPEAMRDRLVPWAARVNDALDACGLARCRGDIMAGNREWCMPESDWRERFGDWMRRPDPAALLNAVVFFDFRAIAGSNAGASRLRAWLAAQAQGQGLFLAALARNALANGPPLGMFGRIATARSGAHRGTIDLKTNGVQLYVETARVLALAAGVPATHTPTRLRAAGAARGMPAADIDACCRGFSGLQTLRLRLNAKQIERGAAPDKHLDPKLLAAGTLRGLREAFQSARGLQARMVREFSLSAPGFGA